jgi:hypothetical protein
VVSTTIFVSSWAAQRNENGKAASAIAKKMEGAVMPIQIQE